MTENESIRILKTDSCCECEVDANSPINCDYGACRVAEATRKAIKALEEIQAYCTIGTPEECGEAVAKHTAKKPIGNDRCTCPSCGTYNETINKRRNTVVCDTVYCWHCGQAIECRRDIDLE